MAKQCYFEQMIKSMGENFINLVTPDKIQNAAKKVAREMVKGEINYQVYGKYIMDPKFLDNFIIALTNEVETDSLYYNAVLLYRQTYPDYPNINIQLNHLGILCNVYSTILNRLYMIRETGNIGCLVDITAMLYQYRTHLG